METKMTKGKWSVDNSFIYCDEKLIARAYMQNVDYSEMTANATLIAASPELLAALGSFVFDIENTRGNDNIFEESYHLAKDAIKKATE